MMKQNRKGFSLIELAIVLVIVSIAIGSGLLVYREYTSQSRYEQTQLRMQLVMSYIKQYALRNNNLPCPADGTLRVSDGNYGIGNYSGTCTSANYTGANMSRGMLPVSSLGVPPALSVDAWGNRFIYAIATPVAAANGLNAAPAAGINILNFNDNLQVVESRPVVVMLLSAGENGYGSYPAVGGGQRAVPGTASNQEKLNAGNTNNFMMSIPFRTFDDLIYFWSFDQIKNSHLMNYAK